MGTEVTIEATPSVTNGNGEAKIKIKRDYMMAGILGMTIMIISGISVLCIFKAPQDGNLVFNSIGFLKEIAMMVAVGHFALSRQTTVNSVG